GQVSHHDLLIRGAERAADSDSRIGASDEGPSHAVTGTPASRSSRTVRSRSIRRIAQASGQNRSETPPAPLRGRPLSTETAPMLAGRGATTIPPGPRAPRPVTSPLGGLAALPRGGEHTPVKVPVRTLRSRREDRRGPSSRPARESASVSTCSCRGPVPAGTGPIR